jgi:hypothetical protein
MLDDFLLAFIPSRTLSWVGVTATLFGAAALVFLQAGDWKFLGYPIHLCFLSCVGMFVILSDIWRIEPNG